MRRWIRAPPGPYFADYAECRGKAPLELQPMLIPRALRVGGPPVSEPKSWLLRVGWLRWGEISFREAPLADGFLVKRT
jgi:hypothetical protein